MLLQTGVLYFYLLSVHGISAHPALFQPTLEDGEIKAVKLDAQLHHLHKRMEGAFQGRNGKSGKGSGSNKEIWEQLKDLEKDITEFNNKCDKYETTICETSDRISAMANENKQTLAKIHEDLVSKKN
ncbi:hypothetical protein PGT21_014270 [Puccinia graminis f. sp. tritici]|uniref:Uncharacterized protein n=1 Tax=Puccinia graminis f. sp. tritici TaxID=56615 RepID=A0A5B0NJ80_PUCGR|nr:hypothetical protein PGT21_014270 [Puccinia graminis f. sp. tritici]KAA1091829.1 hypothetical protein PGTUg99_005170 [Puccinia graminis f. sp. tritici]